MTGQMYLDRLVFSSMNRLKGIVLQLAGGNFNLSSSHLFFGAKIRLLPANVIHSTYISQMSHAHRERERERERDRLTLSISLALLFALIPSSLLAFITPSLCLAEAFLW